jgi:phosphoglycolate phosphatase-like HAD superfamily hydrolase
LSGRERVQTKPGLFIDLATMARRLPEELRHGSPLDAYLLAAGMGQITDDFLHPEVYPIDRAADYLGRRPEHLLRLAGRAASAFARPGRAVKTRWPATRRVLRWRRALAELIAALAGTQAGAVAATGQHHRLMRASEGLLGDLERLPEPLRTAVVRLPACFHNFDQRPLDVMRLVSRFGERKETRATPLLVVGVRTSGSYLAPLCAAGLEAAGYDDVRVLTVRPGLALRRHERALVRSVARRGGLALVTDDPPVTGASIATATRQLERGGFHAGSIVLLLQVFGAAEVPTRLGRHEAVLLPSEEWAVEAALEPSAVRQELSTLLGADATVLAVEPVPLPTRRPARGHVRALFRTRVAYAGGDPVKQDVLVEGVGLGCLGAHALDGARALGRFSPRVFGFEEGLLYREWLPERRRVGSPTPEGEGPVAAAIASYVAQRRRALPASADLSLRMGGDDPAWEVASSAISKAFGRAWPLAKVLLTDRMVKRLLRVERPAVVDGNTDLAQWFHVDPSNGSLLKVNVGENQFSNLGLTCFDPAFDLAGATARAGTPALARRLRDTFAALGNEQIDEERWLLYELAHLWARERTEPETAAALRRARSRALQRYFSDVYLGDIDVPDSGPLCALDLDGVIETEHLGFPGPTPSAALALRALALHGYRPVIATGRSLGEVVERCRAYRLAGGVAEYGAASYESAGGRAREHLPAGAAAAFGRLRAALRAMDGIRLDDDYRLSVRAFRVVGGQRRGLGRETVAVALARAEAGGVRAVEGDGQTDFIADGVDKGKALRALAAQLHDDAPIALAVGDTASDIPMADLARQARAPAHAESVLKRAGFEFTGRPYQAGLAQAVAELIGHRPGSCATCQLRSPARERRLLLTVLGAQERGRRGMALQAMKLAAGVP